MKRKVSFTGRSIAATVLVVAGLLAAGLWLYFAQTRRMQEGVERDLQAIAKLKADEIVAWRTERLADGAVIMESPFFLKGVVAWMTDLTAEGSEDILTRFRSLRDHHHYSDVLLMDPSGQVRVSLTSHSQTLHPDVGQALAAAFRERKPVLCDLHAGGSDQAPGLDVVVPLFAKNGEMPRPLGAVVLQIDPKQFLYPMIQSWPVPSSTAETLLVRRDGDTVLFLNDLRHRPSTGLKLRIPLTRADVPAVLAVLGKEGVIQGLDYRGAKVLSVLRAIPDSPWFMVAKMDVAEALSAQRFSALLIFSLILAILVMAAVSVGVIWQWNEKAHYRSLSQAQEGLYASQEIFGKIINAIPVRVFWKDEDLLFLGCNVLFARDAGLAGPKDIIGKDDYQMVWRDQAGRYRSDDREVIESGCSKLLIEEPQTTPEGKTLFLLTSKVPLLNSKGETVGILGAYMDITERKRAEKELLTLNEVLTSEIRNRREAEAQLRASEEKFRVLFEASSDAIMTLEPPAWRFTSGNPATIKMFKARDEAEFVAKGPWELSPEFQSDGTRSDGKAKAMIAKAMQEDSHSFEWDHMRLDGEVFPATVLLTRVTLGEKVIVQATVRDITETKKAAGVLQASETRHRVLFESSPDGIVIANIETKCFTHANPSICRMLGYTPEELTALGVPNLHPQDQLPHVITEFEALARGEKMVAANIPCLRKDGTVFPADITATSAIINGIACNIGFFRDVTDRQQAEQELAGAAEQWNATFNSISDLVSVQDANHRLVRVNRAYAETFGTSPEQLTGRLCHEIVHGQNHPWPDCPCRTVFETNEPAQVDFFEPSLGVHLEVSVSPIVGPKGEITGCVHIAKNITQRKQAEQQQAEILQKLSEVNRDLQDFAHVISHDLKAPLRAIKTLADWLCADYQDKLDGEGKENLQLLGKRVDRMQNLIDGVLQYSRVGRTEQDLVPVDLSQVVPDIVNSLAAPEHISIHIESDLPTVEADATRVTQVFQNLLSNAIKYMDKPQGNITVGCVEEDGSWKFSVSDNGPGIERQHFDRIFKLFQTLAPRDDNESTGVGLTITKKIVEMYSGKIWVESEVGKGSTFFFTLPQQMAAHVADTGDQVICGQATGASRP